MSRGMGALQQKIHWALCGAPDDGMPLRDLMREAGATDLANFRRSIRSMERTGRVATRLERGEDGVERRIVRSPFWIETRCALRQLIEEEPYPAAYFRVELPAEPDDEDAEDEGEEVDLRKLLAEIAEEEARWERERKAVASEPEPDYGWIDALDLEGLRAALPPAEVHHGEGYTRETLKKRWAAK